MAAIVADTHAAIWYLTNSPRLSPVAANAFDQASAAGDPILIASISLVELIPDGPYELAPLDGRVAAAVERIDRNVVPDLPDRVIAATALATGTALVSRDGKIRASQIETIW
jgi:PIN domain nuclease of toxin-antitoxin system